MRMRLLLANVVAIGLLAWSLLFSAAAADADQIHFQGNLTSSAADNAAIGLGLGITQGIFDDVLGVLTIDTAVYNIGLGELEGDPYAIHRALPGLDGPEVQSLGDSSEWFELGMALVGIGHTSADIDIDIAVANFAQDLKDGFFYVLLKTSEFPDGQLRGQLIVSEIVPEPTTFGMIASGLLGLLAMGSRRLDLG